VALSASHPVTAAQPTCRHCGESCDRSIVESPLGTFCCDGCEAVYRILQEHDLGDFYTCAPSPGLSQRGRSNLDDARFAVLDEPRIAGEFLEFDDGRMARAVFAVPALHCASCVWLLEQFWRFDPAVTRSEVDLQRRTLRVEYNPSQTSLRRIAEQLAALGYEPLLSIERSTGAAPGARRRLYLQLGVAGFAFGNIMLFSIPRYVNAAPLEGGFQQLFDALNIALAVPVLLFSVSDYFRTSWQALRHLTITLDVPVALGLGVLFLRSVADIASGRGEGFMDSFAGLAFFLLLGRLFQQKVFDRISFDRTYRSFLPLSVRREAAGGVQVTPLERLEPGDRIRLRRREVVPADGRLLDERGTVDYAFITGEEAPLVVRRGDVVRAGGRAGGAMRLSIERPVSQSQLAALWNNPVFGKEKPRWLTNLAAGFGAWFTVGAIGLAAAGAIAWWPDAAASASVATAVLIVACPCALTLSAPLALGTAMGQLGTRGLYLKQPAVALDLSRIDMVVFDKTGTLTGGNGQRSIEGGGLSDQGWRLVCRLAQESVHPVSRAIAQKAVATDDLPRPAHVREMPGQGISGIVGGEAVAIGSAAFIAKCTGRPTAADDRTYLVAGSERGWVRLSSPARPGIEEATAALGSDHDIYILSGDRDAEWTRWLPLFGPRMRFQQSPDDKLAFVRKARAEGRRVLMAGDGLNDAGALAAADVGLAVSDDTSCIVPACDGVIAGDRLTDLPAFLRYARRARAVVIACVAVSVAYNAIGLTLALSGRLTPLASAVLMPVSSITVIGLSAGLMRWSARRILRP
jgi:Cu+-exporting ATPase